MLQAKHEAGLAAPHPNGFFLRLAVNQYTVTEDKRTRRPDVVLFVNGIPLVVIELKNAGDQNATTLKAFRQLQTYKQELPTLMTYNVALVASDGMTAKVGTLTADWERFMPWRTIDASHCPRQSRLP